MSFLATQQEPKPIHPRATSVFKTCILYRVPKNGIHNYYYHNIQVSNSCVFQTYLGQSLF